MTVQHDFTVNLTAAIPADASVTLTLADGSQVVFSAAKGIELDPFIDPFGGFTQRAIVCTNPALPDFWAWYRPDLGGVREEWVFEFGNPWALAAVDMAGYKAVITTKTGIPITFNIPYHWWFSRWRWQSDVRPVRADIHDLMEAGLIPFLDASMCYGPQYTINAYTPMSLCGIPADQGQTGIYPGIGLITGGQAQYITRHGPEWLFRNQAEASGTVQWHVRDPNTRRPFDWCVQYPKATMYSSTVGSPFIRRTQQTKPDSGHHPSLAYVPYLLTGDLYYLEEQQFLANHIPLQNPPNMRWSDRGRYCAWPFRSTVQAWLITPDKVPSWLLPRAAFDIMLAQQHTIMMSHVNDTTDPWDTVFHDMMDSGQSSAADPANSGSHVWQTNYTIFATAWAAGIPSLRTDWLAVAEWAARNAVDRASSTSGYQRAHPSPYHIRYRNAGALAVAMSGTDTSLKLQYADTFAPNESVTIDSETMKLVSSVDGGITWAVTRTAPRAHAVGAFVYGRKFTSWSDVMKSEILRKPTAWVAPPTDVMVATNLDYPSNHYAALTQAVNSRLNVPGLADAQAWFEQQMRSLASTKMIVHDNWCVVKQ